MPTTRRHAAWLPLLAAAVLTLSGCGLIPGLGGGSGSGSGSGSNGDSGSDTQPSGDTVDIFSLAVGDCINEDTGNAEVSDTVVIDCGQPHLGEVYASVQVPEGDGTFPGDSAIDDQVKSDCVAQFTTFVGIDYSESALDITDLQPTQESWDSGDREILCIVTDSAGPTTGSLQGAAR